MTLNLIESHQLTSAALVMVGVQGCGKSTLADKLSRVLPCTISSSDHIRALLSKVHDELDHTVPHEAVWRILYHEVWVVQALNLSPWVIVDATNIIVRHRRELVSHLQRFWPTVVAIRHHIPEEEILHRNALRRLPRPPEVVDRYLGIFRNQDPLMRHDGFDHVLQITHRDQQ